MIDMDKISYEKFIMKKSIMKLINKICGLKYWSVYDVYKNLKKYKFYEEAEIFLREEIDGDSLIIIFTEKDGLNLLNQMGLSFNQICDLYIMYNDIYYFRTKYFKTGPDEEPYIITNYNNN